MLGNCLPHSARQRVESHAIGLDSTTGTLHLHRTPIHCLPFLHVEPNIPLSTHTTSPYPETQQPTTHQCSPACPDKFHAVRSLLISPRSAPPLLSAAPSSSYRRNGFWFDLGNVISSPGSTRKRQSIDPRYTNAAFQYFCYNSILVRLSRSLRTHSGPEGEILTLLREQLIFSSFTTLGLPSQDRSSETYPRKILNSRVGTYDEWLLPDFGYALLSNYYYTYFKIEGFLFNTAGFFVSLDTTVYPTEAEYFLISEEWVWCGLRFASLGNRNFFELALQGWVISILRIKAQIPDGCNPRNRSEFGRVGWGSFLVPPQLWSHVGHALQKC